MWERDYPDGLNVSIFVQIILDSVDCPPEDKYDLLHGALSLFSEIDINGDQSMEWGEFMQYMIDAVGTAQSIVNKEDKGVLERIEEQKAS